MEVEWETWVIVIGGGFAFVGSVYSLAGLWHHRHHRRSREQDRSALALFWTSLGVAAGFLGTVMKEVSGLLIPLIVVGAGVVVALFRAFR
jgi:hypothetical protein